MKQRGFTLIELLVVIAIIGLLASIVMVSLNSARAKARDSRRMGDLKQVALALEMYYDTNGAYPTGNYFNPWCLNWGYNCATELQDALASYLNKLPVDPVNKEAGAGNFLGDDAPTDQGYRYWCDNGQRYILGTNLENVKGRTHSANEYGNYEIRVGI